MFLILRKKELAFFSVGLVILLGILLSPKHGAISALAPGRSEEKMTVVIDAGHGGEDGGAVAADGTAESGINLAIAERLCALLRFCGCDVVMTRSEDKAIYSDGAETLRQKKVSDLKNRVALVNGLANAALLSVHQNSMPSAPRVHGAQVFYAAAAGSDTLAQQIQGILNDAVNDSEKSAKKIAQGVYLMKNVTHPAALIECGFLSNNAETEKLKTEEYQMRLALCIAGGYLNWEAERIE